MSSTVPDGGSEHPNAERVSRFLTAWFAGDLETWGALAADDIVIHMRGKPTLNGRYLGRQGVLEFFGKFAGLAIDGMTMDVEDVVADDRFACAMMRSIYLRGAETLELLNACAYRLTPDGKIAEVWNVSDHQHAEHQFFAVAPESAAVRAAP